MVHVARHAKGRLLRRRWQPAGTNPHGFDDNWRVTHKLGNVFALTNLAAHASCDVDVVALTGDVDVRLRRGPWRVVAAGETTEFVAICDPMLTGQIAVRWTAKDGTANAAEIVIAPARGPAGLTTPVA
jgi:hypothetical protein